MSNSHEQLISRFEKGINAFEEAMRGIPDSLLDREPAPGKWTIRKIAAHMADAELVCATRIRFIAAEPGCAVKVYDQDLWADKLNYGRQNPSVSLQLFRAVRTSSVALLRSLPESMWTNTGKHEERGEVTLEGMVELYADHAESHAHQIRDIRSKSAASA